MLESLGDKPFPAESSNAHRVEGSPDLYVMPTLGRLRIVYAREADGSIVVQDVVNQGIIDRYFRKPAPVASAGEERMKVFDSVSFSHAAAMAELGDLKALLDMNPELSEKDDILPFFRQRRHLSLAVGLLSSNLSSLDRLAYEYDLFGDFSCDLVIGDSNGPAFAPCRVRRCSRSKRLPGGLKIHPRMGPPFRARLFAACRLVGSSKINQGPVSSATASAALTLAFPQC